MYVVAPTVTIILKKTSLINFMHSSFLVSIAYILIVK